jgi:hypothetical protein
MSRAALSIFVFGLYLLATSIVLILSPNTMLGLLGVALATEPWVHILGVVVGTLGLYYVVAARAEVTAFIRATIWVRALVLVGFTGLVLVNIAPMQIIGFGVVDVLGAAWTWMALRPTVTAA